MNIDKNLFKQSIKQANKQNALEDKIAMEWFGCKYDELDEDDREQVTYEALDRM